MNRLQLIKICTGIVVMILVAASIVVYIHLIRNSNINNSTKHNATQTLAENSGNSDLTQALPKEAECELYQSMLLTTLYPYIQKSVTGYYGRNDVFAPPYMDKILNATNTDGATYEINVEAQPYVGPHDLIGIDHITILVSPLKIEVLKFQHIKSFSLPPNLQ